MTAAIRHRKIVTVLAASALALTSTLIITQSAHAGIVDVWTTYPSMSACQNDLVNLNDFCYGLQDGQAIGLIDASLAIDELDQSLGIFYQDQDVLPAPEGPANPVVQVWNNTSSYTFIAPGTSAYNDAAGGIAIYYIPPHTDYTGPAFDAVSDTGTWTIDYDTAILITATDLPPKTQTVSTGQY